MKSLLTTKTINEQINSKIQKSNRFSTDLNKCVSASNSKGSVSSGNNKANRRVYVMRGDSAMDRRHRLYDNKPSARLTIQLLSAQLSLAAGGEAR